MPKGSVGSSTFLIYTRKKKKRPANCKLCKNGTTIGKETFCNVSGEVTPVNKKRCEYYVGSCIRKSNKKGK